MLRSGLPHRRVLPRWIVRRELRRRGIPYCVSLRGTLDRWSREQKLFKKRLAWRLYQRRLLERARAIFALTDEEVAEAREWLPHERYCVAPNGAEVPTELPLVDVLTEHFPAILNGASPHKTAEGSEPAHRPPVILFMARLHHKKGLDLLPQILKRVRERHPPKNRPLPRVVGGTRGRD